MTSKFKADLLAYDPVVSALRNWRGCKQVDPDVGTYSTLDDHCSITLGFRNGYEEARAALTMPPEEIPRLLTSVQDSLELNSMELFLYRMLEARLSGELKC